MARPHSDPAHVDAIGAPAIAGPLHPLALVYGGGGAFGIAFGLGVAHGLAQAGIPVAAAPALGTSAGSWVAAAVALGLGYDAFEHVEAPRVPTARRGILAELARGLFGEQRHHLVSVSAVCLTTRRRHILDGGLHPLADLVAASSAVPGLFPPHAVAGRRYIDGGMWSATSIDAAAHAERVIVVAPMARRVLGPVGLGAGLLLERELRQWRRRHPGREIVLVGPDSAVGQRAGVNPLGLFDAARARPVYPLAVELGRRYGERLQGQPVASG
jgi:NTE family protein